MGLLDKALASLERARTRLENKDKWSPRGWGDGEKRCAVATISAESEKVKEPADLVGPYNRCMIYLLDSMQEIHGGQQILALNDGQGKFEGMPEEDRLKLIRDVYDRAIEKVKKDIETEREYLDGRL